MAKPVKLETDTGQPFAQTVKLNVMLGVYHKGILGHTERYADLKTANSNGRAWEKLGYQVVIHCGVSKLPDEYPQEGR